MGRSPFHRRHWKFQPRWYVINIQDTIVLGSSDIFAAQYAASIAALTVTASAATFNNINIDDVLAVARPHADKKSEYLTSTS